jgi:predicted MFS family arabinose efflux permease
MSRNNKQWLGLPLHLIWGYIAIAVFMTGDGFELAFLSHYIKSLGFTPAEASFAFTLYGLAAALSAWVSGVVAEIITPQKTMLIGFVLWCVFHVLFLVFGLGQANYGLILLFYGIRGLAYPLFLYSFIVVIIHNVRSENSSSALGRAGLINSGGAAGGETDLSDAVRTAVINKRAGGMGLILGRKAFKKSMADGVKLINAVQDVYLDNKVTIA